MFKKKTNDFKEKTSKNFRIYLPAFFKYFCTCYRHSSSVLPGTTRCTEELRAHLPQPTPEVTTGRTTELHPGGRSSLRPFSQVCTTQLCPRGVHPFAPSLRYVQPSSVPGAFILPPPLRYVQPSSVPGAFIPLPSLSGMYNQAPSQGHSSLHPLSQVCTTQLCPRGIHPFAPSLRYVQPSSVPGAFIPPPPLSGMYNPALSQGHSSLHPLSQVCRTKLRPGGHSSLHPLSQVCTTQLCPRGIHPFTPSLWYVQPSSVSGAFIPLPPLSGMYNQALSQGHSSLPHSLRYVQPSSVSGAFIPPPPLSGMYNPALSQGHSSLHPLSQVCTTKLCPRGIHPSTPSLRYVQPSSVPGAFIPLPSLSGTRSCKLPNHKDICCKCVKISGHVWRQIT